MSNRFRIYLLGMSIIVLFCGGFFGRNALNAYYHHSRAAVPFSALTAGTQDQAIIITNNQAPAAAQNSQRSSKVLRSDGTILLDGNALGRSEDHEQNIFTRFTGFRLSNGDRYVSAGVPGPDYSEDLELYKVTAETTLEKVDIGKLCHSMQSPYGMVHCTVQQMSVSPNNRWTLMSGDRLINKNDDNLQNRADRQFLTILDSTSNTQQQLTLKTVLEKNNITLLDGLSWEVQWTKDDPETLFITVLQDVTGQQRHVALFTYHPESQTFETQSLTADYGPFVAPAEPVVPVNVFAESAIHRQLGFTHTVKFADSSLQNVVGQIRWKAMNTPYTSSVYPLQSGKGEHKFLVIINDYMYVYDTRVKQYALLDRLPFISPSDMLIYSVDVLLPRGDVQ